MHAKPILHTLLLIFILTILGACSMGNVDSAQLDGDTLKITSGKDLFLLQICRPDLLNVDYRYKGESSPDTPVLDSNAKWDTGNITSSALHSDPMVIKTTKMTVKISKKPCRLAIYDPAGNLLLKEQNSEGVYKDGVKFTHNNPHANFYGISGYDAWENSAAGIIRNSGGSVYAGQQGHCAAPMVFTANYGLLVDSDGGKFTIDHTKLEFSGVRKKPQDSKEIPKKNVKYYIAVGPPKSVLSAMSAVTGRPPMLPRWAMGFMNSEWGIDQKELASHVNSYRAKGIPIDAYILDFDYKDWGGGDFGEFKWNHANFPDGADGVLKANMDKVGIKLCGIMKPRLVIKNPDDTLTKQAQFINAKEQSEGGWWYPGLKAYLDYTSDVYHRPIWCKDVNFANANVRKWFWEQTKHFFATGIRGYWNDEADNVSAKNDFKFNFDNFQFLNMQRALYEGQKNATNLRVWSTNRNYYMGAQRYAYTMWSGDLPQGFESMAKQRERLLSAVNVGQVKWGMDIGGFAQTPTPQNYARWVQFGAFIPLFRVHGEKDEQRQPWKYGLTGENAIKEAIRLRYALIPYIYHYERTAFEAGVGLDRPLFYQYPHDAKVAKAIDAWLFGDYFIIAPVVAENQTSKQIYLPKGTAWVDFFRGKSYNGGTTVTYPLNP
ncbi:MAG: glycoside hydrolase family 31 protein, partial [Bacillota bacterium]